MTADAIRSALAKGDLRDDDLVRPAGTSVAWRPLADVPELLAPPLPPPEHPTITGQGSAASKTPASAEESERLPDFEEVQPKLEEIIPPAKSHQRTELPGAASPSDVAFPVLNEEVKPPRPAPPDPPVAHQPGEPSAWIWADDDEDEDEDEDDRPIVLEDHEDIEILADEDDLVDHDRVPPGKVTEPVTPKVDFTHHREHSEKPSVQPDRPAHELNRWELSDQDLDLDQRPDSRSSHVALPVVHSRDRDPMIADDAGEDSDTSVSLARSATRTIEELDLAPMVDVAFQLVLFFMVTATTVLYKTLEIPKPSGEAPAAAVTQGRSRSLEDLKDDYILVEIDDRGAMKLDREPIEPVMATLVEQLRRAREKTNRKSMLLSADFATPHRNAVLAYDAANEIGLGIAIARPQPPMGPAPTLKAAPVPAAQPATPATPGPS